MSLGGGTFIKISRAGTMLDRCILDHLAIGPERLVFEAEPVVRGGLQLRPRCRTPPWTSSRAVTSTSAP